MLLGLVPGPELVCVPAAQNISDLAALTSPPVIILECNSVLAQITSETTV